MKKIKQLLALFLTFVLAVSLCGCSSDYPVVNREMKIADFISACFEGTGYSVPLDGDETVIVNGVADRMSIDMEQSSDTISDIQSAVRKATATQDGLTGTWEGQVDISPIICEVFYDLKGIKMEDYMDGLIIDAEMTFTSDGVYTMHFSREAVENARDEIMDRSVSAAKGYVDSLTGVERLVGNAIPEDVISDIMIYVVRFGVNMLENGTGGNYAANGTKLTFTDNGSCTYKLTDDQLTISNADCTGIPQVFNGKTTTFTRS